MRTTRRGLLAAAGLAATAGCADLLGSGSAAPFRQRQIADVSETVRIQSGEFWAREFSFDTQSVLLFSVVASDPVDVILFRRSAYETYRADVRGETDAARLEHIGQLSDLGTTATARGSAVSAGEPVLVIDNTTWESAAPVEEVRVEVDVEAFVRSERFRGEATPEQDGGANASRRDGPDGTTARNGS